MLKLLTILYTARGQPAVAQRSMKLGFRPVVERRRKLSMIWGRSWCDGCGWSGRLEKIDTGGGDNPGAPLRDLDGLFLAYLH